MTEVSVRQTNGNGAAAVLRHPSQPRPAISSLKTWLRRVRGGEGVKAGPGCLQGCPGEVSLPLVETPPRPDSPEQPSPQALAPFPLSRQAIRSNYMDKSIEAKKKVIRMLFVVVAEFFVCWAPLHVLNTWYLFSPEVVYQYVGSTGVSLVQLLAYISSCCNPITYCFMNRKFRQAFLSLFNCPRWCCGGRCSQRTGRLETTAGGNNSELSANDSTVYAGRACRSEVVVLDKDERV